MKVYNALPETFDHRDTFSYVIADADGRPMVSESANGCRHLMVCQHADLLDEIASQMDAGDASFVLMPQKSVDDLADGSLEPTGFDVYTGDPKMPWLCFDRCSLPTKRMR